MRTHTEANAIALGKELLWLRSIFYERTLAYDLSRTRDDVSKQVFSLSPPVHDQASAPFVQFITEYDLGFEDRALLILALAPNLDPAFIDMHGTSKVRDERAAMLGVRGTLFRGTIPTMLTYLFLLAGDNLMQRMRLLERFGSDHLFVREQVLHVEPHYEGDPAYSGRLILSHKHMLLFTTGELMPLVKIPTITNKHDSHERA